MTVGCAVLSGARLPKHVCHLPLRLRDAKTALAAPHGQREVIGCFGLTEPDSGSDPGSMRTMARQDGDAYVLNGAKMWITNAPICHLAVVWAKLEEDDPQAVRGFLVERDTPGSRPGPSSRRCPCAPHTRARSSSLTAVSPKTICCRPHVAWGRRGLPQPGALWHCLGALGAAKACFDSALDYSRQRVQFGVPIASKQLIQEQLVDMALEIARASS